MAKIIVSSASKPESAKIVAVYGSGLLQGIALIIFPAAGPLLTNPAFHGLTSGQFGVLFTPQIVLAIIASSLAARLGTRRALQAGLIADVLAMLLLAGSQLAIPGEMAFPVLLAATGAVGAGFGFAISALNTLALELFPARRDAAVTGLHVLIGLGQVGAALILAGFVGLGIWWGAPLTVAALLIGMLMFGGGVGAPPLLEGNSTPSAGMGKSSTRKEVSSPRTLPARVWVFAVVIFLYGLCETAYGAWSAIYLEEDAGLAMGQAALGLSLFWGAVTVGRVLYAAGSARWNLRAVYLAAPFVAAAALFVLPSLPKGLTLAGVMLGGLGLSFLFPATVSVATEEQPTQTTAISGAMVAAIMIGTGVSANVIGAARAMLGLGMIFRLVSLAALGMGVLSLYLMRSKNGR